jgi:hypothetical protein
LQEVVLRQPILKGDECVRNTLIVFLEVVKPGCEIFTLIFIHSNIQIYGFPLELGSVLCSADFLTDVNLVQKFFLWANELYLFFLELYVEVMLCHVK